MKLGSEAVYRVCGFTGELVQVEVVSAPCLAAGQRFTFVRAAVLSMSVVLDGSTPSGEQSADFR